METWSCPRGTEDSVFIWSISMRISVRQGHLEPYSVILFVGRFCLSCRHKMLTKGALAVALSAIVVEAIDNGLARTPQMGWVRLLLF